MESVFVFQQMKEEYCHSISGYHLFIYVSGHD
jgi:hypothetical protein